MSCEESYLAIIRYLTDEHEPYAPGTPGNTKRKIRKAAACYVVRNGTLFYQRRQKGQNEFTELEVVLQDSRRRELINQAHIIEGGEHLNQQLTWEIISQKYWWRGILKNVKDHIRECTQCQSKRSADDGSGPRPFSRLGRRKLGPMEEEDDEEEEDGEDSLFTADLTSQRPKLAKEMLKHEVVFVDSKGEVNQFLPKHSQTMLDKLNQQRLSNQFCDITLLIEGEEHRAHKAVLAACSEYFNELFFEKGAMTTHEAVVDLSGFAKSSFLPLLDFAYTSVLTFNFCVMADIANLARHLLMTEVLQICESVHKQVEEQKLTVYQKGDVHTVVAGPMAAQDAKEETDAYMVTIQGDGSTVVTHSAVTVSGDTLAFIEQPTEASIQQPVTVLTHAVDGDTVHTVEAGESETVALIAHSGEVENGETLTLLSGCAEGLEGETMTVVTHSGQAGASESLAVVSACLAMEQPRAVEAGAFVIDVDADKEGPSDEVVLLSEVDAPQSETTKAQKEETVPVPQKRKRGRPPKVKREVEEEGLIPAEEDPSADEEHADKHEGALDDRSKRRLRQRSMAEGGYARLHMGLEDEEEGKSTTPPPPTPPKLVKMAKRLKKEKVNVDIINFGEEKVNTDKLTAFINTLNGKEGTGSNLVTVPPGPSLADTLLSSPILAGEGGSMMGLGASDFEFGVDPSADPELALALRVSMEEQRQRQEEEARRATAASAAEAGMPTPSTDESEEALLKMSVSQPESGAAVLPDISSMTEEEQIAYAMQMSLAGGEYGEMDTGAPMDTAESAKEEDDYDVMQDPEFLQSVLENLPGVDPNNEAIRNAMGSLASQTGNKQDGKKDEEKKK
ncbi:hypothetical protein ATANTOWER_022205 [Ataeniobius toweri]|uniref:BTB domain-containing protein n=1 Tax=Ataeniobius toweri TaxID=208326 RepID=A0ABU7B2F7_9TELE|nr:hypothetical protein [Ataeniobius toweri]